MFIGFMLKGWPKKLFLLLIFLTGVIKPQIYTQKDIAICKDKFQLLIDQRLTQKPIGDVMIAIGKSSTPVCLSVFAIALNWQLKLGWPFFRSVLVSKGLNESAYD